MVNTTVKNMVIQPWWHSNNSMARAEIHHPNATIVVHGMLTTPERIWWITIEQGMSTSWFFSVPDSTTLLMDEKNGHCIWLYWNFPYCNDYCLLLPIPFSLSRTISLPIPIIAVVITIPVSMLMTLGKLLPLCCWFSCHMSLIMC